MVPVVLLGGLVVAAVATITVYADALRRDVPRRTRHLWAGSVGFVSSGAFVGLCAFGEVLYRAYLGLMGTPKVVHSPRGLVTGLLVGGLAVSSVAVLAYGVGSRYGPLESA